MKESSGSENKKATGDAQRRTELTGAAWTDKPAKADGMTNAEGFTNRKK